MSVIISVKCWKCMSHGVRSKRSYLSTWGQYKHYYVIIWINEELWLTFAFIYYILTTKIFTHTYLNLNFKWFLAYIRTCHNRKVAGPRIKIKNVFFSFFGISGYSTVNYSGTFNCAVRFWILCLNKLYQKLNTSKGEKQITYNFSYHRIIISYCPSTYSIKLRITQISEIFTFYY